MDIAWISMRSFMSRIKDSLCGCQEILLALLVLQYKMAWKGRVFYLGHMTVHAKLLIGNAARRLFPSNNPGNIYSIITSVRINQSNMTSYFTALSVYEGLQEKIVFTN